LTPNIPAGTGPVIDLIDGAVVQTTSSGFNYNGESDLDLEYAIALGNSDPSQESRTSQLTVSSKSTLKK
jgi:hypothetical protein